MTTCFDWAVVGAGPAGIAAVGKLLDGGVDAKKIAWVDPEFKVGDFGACWSNVPSNTTAKLFTAFLNNCSSFCFADKANDFELSHLDPKKSCHLHHMAEPLQWVSDCLSRKITTFQTTLKSMQLTQRQWMLKSNDMNIAAKQVVLATGAVPKNLSLSTPADIISLEVALDKEQLKQHCSQQDTVAVFGSSHSAVLVLRNLVELDVKRIINFYRNPLRYAIVMDGWILHDSTGLKASTADWARDHLDGELPSNLERYMSTVGNVEKYVPECDKTIYSVGFERRVGIDIDGFEHLNHDPHTGIIAPGLFGFGIAYPESYTNPLGAVEERVGLWKFMDYLNRVMPVWMKYST